ncbi:MULTISPECIES: DUF6415 family natural product biosynthesis protein [unclassified Streptomyces]|uniref:DUF6415 family natural product biosynthesis protein n=1 Tax=unclassified Streptomyces TaxID=2593676 RepID=UPI0038243F91
MHRIPVDTVAVLVAKTLVPYNLKPPDGEIEVLRSGLARHGEQLRGEVVRLGRADAAAAALEDWRALIGSGPEDTPLGAWNHARALARAVKAFRHVIDSGPTEP